MIRYLAASLLFLSSCATATPPSMELPINGGVDGDTIKTTLPLPAPLSKASVRIRDIDTPEKGKRAKCVREDVLAQQAAAVTRQIIGSATTMVVIDPQWDKYGGRIDGIVLVNGRNIGRELIGLGLAKPYTGRGPKPDWCNIYNN